VGNQDKNSESSNDISQSAKTVSVNFLRKETTDDIHSLET
jgi:hypothetical protein